MIPKDFIVYDRHALPWVRVQDGLPTSYSEVVVHGTDSNGFEGQTQAYIRPTGEWFVYADHITNIFVTHWFYLSSPNEP